MHQEMYLEERQEIHLIINLEQRREIYREIYREIDQCKHLHKLPGMRLLPGLPGIRRGGLRETPHAHRSHVPPNRRPGTV